MLVILLIVIALPEKAIDPWSAISLRKIGSLVGALSFIQLLGIELGQKLGLRRGAIVSGFLGGLVSSTAVVTEVARRSHEFPAASSMHFLTIASSTVAMQTIGIFLFFVGDGDHKYPLLLIFVFPILFACLAIFRERGASETGSSFGPAPEFKLSHVLTLSVFIIGTIVLSKILQAQFPLEAIGALTFIGSLFEMHGSIVANIQLQAAGFFETSQLASMFYLSVLGSFTSKVVIVLLLGSKELRWKMMIFSFFSFLFLTLGLWVTTLFPSL